MSDYSCLKEHLPKTLGQTIHQCMVRFVSIATVAVCLGASAERQQEDLCFGTV